MRIQGRLSSQPLVVTVVAPSGLAEKTVEGRLHLRAEKFDPAMIGKGRALLDKKIAQYVPSTQTADEWNATFDCYLQERQFSNPAASVASIFEDFCAALYARTTLCHVAKDGSVTRLAGFLEVSSVYTYLRYITMRRRSLAFLPSFRAIETEASSIGAKHKAPKADSTVREILRDWIAQQPKDDAEHRTRAGCWLQTVTGGREVDINRLRGGGVELRTHDASSRKLFVHSVDWSWTKSIKKSKDSKTCHPPEEAFALMGFAPFTRADWLRWSKKEFVLGDYQVNPSLKELCKVRDIRPILTSTSLRDIYHDIVKEVCKKDPEQMKKYTPHKSSKSLSASYMSSRKTAKVTKKKKASEPKKKRW